MRSGKIERCLEPIGIGGRKCGCCNSFHGTRKKLLNRILRRKLKYFFEKEIRNELKAL